VKRLLLTVVLLMLWCAAAVAAPVPPLEALEQLRASFAAMQDFTAEISQEKQLAVMKRKLVTSGTVRFKKPDLFFMELKPPYPSRMVLRDATIDLYLPLEKSRQQMNLGTDEGLKRWLSLLAQPIRSLPDGVEVKADRSGDQQTVTISPKKKGQVRLIAITSGLDGLLRKLLIEERNGNRTMIAFQRLRANVGLTDRDFRVE
jgi:outer membrane lipoprotein carrier protein